MNDDIKARAQGIDPTAHPRNVNEIAEQSSNVYKSLVVVSTRARQISGQLKRELQSKLEEFSAATDALEEVNENKEQIEISKFYERLPNPVIIAMHEFMEGDLVYRKRDQKQREGDY